MVTSSSSSEREKRVENARKEVEDAKAKVVATEMTLTSE